MDNIINSIMKSVIKPVQLKVLFLIKFVKQYWYTYGNYFVLIVQYIWLANSVSI